VFRERDSSAGGPLDESPDAVEAMAKFGAPS
jgi:hypothetical protein